MTGQMKSGAMPKLPRHPDATLLALGREIAEVEILLSRASTLFFESDNRCGELIADGIEPAEAERQTGVLLAEAAEKRVSRRYSRLCEAILVTPARTVSGLAIKARIIRNMHPDMDRSEITTDMKLLWSIARDVLAISDQAVITTTPTTISNTTAPEGQTHA